MMRKPFKRAASQPTAQRAAVRVQQMIGPEAGNPVQVAVGGARRWVSDGGTGQMATTNPINKYLATLDEPKRATLTSLRDTIMAIVPEAEQCISYGMPAFKCGGRPSQGSRPSKTTSATCPIADRCSPGC